MESPRTQAFEGGSKFGISGDEVSGKAAVQLLAKHALVGVML